MATISSKPLKQSVSNLKPLPVSNPTLQSMVSEVVKKHLRQ